MLSKKEIKYQKYAEKHMAREMNKIYGFRLTRHPALKYKPLDGCSFLCIKDVKHNAKGRNRPIAFVGWVKNPDSGASPVKYELKRLWVDKRFRRNGFAQEVITHALEKMRFQGISSAWFWVGTKQTPAIRLYKKLGAKIVESNADDIKYHLHLH